MNKTIFVAVALLASTAALADGPIGYPGSTWGQVTFPSSSISGSPDNHDVVYQGRVTQGIDWLRFGSDKKWTLDTYGAFGFTLDDKHLWWNDKIVPAVGVKLDRGFRNGVVSVGVEGSYEHHFGQEGVGASPGSPVKMNGAGVNAYVSYWFGWNLK